MKKLTLLFCTLMLSHVSWCQFTTGQKIKSTEVKESGTKTYMSLKEPIKSTKLGSGLLIQIEPLDASKLDEQFYLNSGYSGKYENIHYETKISQHFNDLKKRKRRVKKPDDQFKQEGIYYLLDNEEISEEIFEEFNKELTEGKEKDSVEFFTSENKQNFNPFHLHSFGYGRDQQLQYLNVFRVTIKNVSSTPITNDLNYTIFNGGESLQALSSDEIISKLYYLYEASRSKIQNLVRGNINNQVIFPGNSTTVGYFATLPLNLTDELIDVFISNNQGTTKLSWQADVKKEDFNNVHKFYEIALKPSVFTYDALYVFEGKVDNMYAVENKLYVKESDVDQPIVIHYYGMSRNKLYHGKTDQIKASDFIDFQKMRADRIKISASWISEVKRYEKND